MRPKITYDGDDTIAYLLSLITVAIVFYLIVPYVYINALIFAALAYLAFTFWLRFGFRLNLQTIPKIALGLARYPFELLYDMKTALKWMAAAACCFVIALALQSMLQPSLTGTFLANPFPFEFVFAISIAIVESYRIATLVAHLKKSDMVEKVLSESPYAPRLKGMSIRHHILHGYATGVVTYLTSFVPFYLMCKLTSPTYFREIFLALSFPFVSSFFVKTFGQSFHPTNFENFATEHERDHRSYFRFTFFHGHHHDAIPSAVIAGTNAGILEAINRGIVRMGFLSGTIYQLLYRVPMIALGDMIGHQYIPGVFPYSKFVGTMKMHHMTHHYLSLMPYSYGGFMDFPYILHDIGNGYNPDNHRAKWFVSALEKYEDSDPLMLAKFSRRDESLAPGQMTTEYISKVFAQCFVGGMRRRPIAASPDSGAMQPAADSLMT